MNIALVINSIAGGGKGRKMGDSLARQLTSRGIHFTLIRENDPVNTLLTLKRVAQKNPLTMIISVGGDGLAHLLFPQAIELNVPIFVAPAGTGNDFARTTHTLGLDATEIVDLIMTRPPVRIDMGFIEHGDKSSWFGQVLSTGFDSLVNERANSYKVIRGKVKYVVATARELPFFVPRTYKVTIDERVIEAGAMLVAIANGKSYGGGMQVCPDADLRDGLFDILLLRPIPVREFIRVFPKVFSGKHVSHPAVDILRGKRVTLESKAVAYADGERVGSLPVTVTNRPNAMLTWVL
jgi:diacylglycerol kinase (ATP)